MPLLERTVLPGLTGLLLLVSDDQRDLASGLVLARWPRAGRQGPTRVPALVAGCDGYSRPVEQIPADRRWLCLSFAL